MDDPHAEVKPLARKFEEFQTGVERHLATKLKEAQSEVERLATELKKANAREGMGFGEQVKKRLAGIAGRPVWRFGKFGAWIFITPDLLECCKNWLEARSLRDPLPIEETAHLGAAIVRRVFYVGALGLMAAMVPMGLLVWKNLLIGAQNKFFQEQIEQTEQQFTRQEDGTYRVRKADLIQSDTVPIRCQPSR
jgi:hypothetical protein